MKDYFGEGFREHQFSYFPETEGLPKELICVIEYEYVDQSFDAHGLSGELGLVTQTGAEVLSFKVYSEGQLVNPEDLEPGLTRILEQEALSRITEDL